MRLLLLISGLFFSVLSFSQETYHLEIQGDDFTKVQKKIPSKFKDSISVLSFLRSFQAKAIALGYPLSSIDSIQKNENSFSVQFFLGDRIKEIRLNIKDDDLQFIKKAGIKEKQIAKLPFKAKEISAIMNELLMNSLNNGYPFAKVQIANLNYEKNEVTADLVLSKGKFFEWKDIHIKGDTVLNKNTIASLVGIHIGNKYKEDDLRYISENIRQVNYLKIIKPYELLFTEEGVELFLYLESVPVSSANGILGLQPNSVTQKMSVTGELNLKLVNLLHRAETMQIAWKSVKAGTQNLQIGLNYPFLFKTPFGLDGTFQLHKQDTSFLETKTTAGVQYFLGRGSYLKAFYSLYTSDLIVGTNSTSSLNAGQSLRTSSYGMSLFKRQLDYLPNPSKGIVFLLEAQIGQRTLTSIDTIATKNVTGSLKLTADWYINLGKRNVLRLNGTFSTYYAPTVYKNELLRMGGLNSLRGFNEEELNATTFSALTLEYRFLTDRNSHAFVFFNQGMYENRSNTYYRDFPFGFGLGYAFGTPIGIFSISTALGKQFNNPILLRESKIHFGYIAYF